MRAHQGCYHRSRVDAGRDWGKRRSGPDRCCHCRLTRGQAGKTVYHPPDAPALRCARLPPLAPASSPNVLVQSGRTSYAGLVANPPRSGAAPLVPPAPPPTLRWARAALLVAAALLLGAACAATALKLVGGAVSP